jgi:CubicO group peptidase (beta-lactamase class C family)
MIRIVCGADAGSAAPCPSVTAAVTQSVLCRSCLRYVSRRWYATIYADLADVYFASPEHAPDFSHSRLNVIRSACVLCVLSVISAVAQETAKPDPAASARGLRDQTDKVFTKWDSTVSPGCALSVMQDGQIIYSRGYGMADLDHDVAITPETIFHVASISKQFTAAAIVLLAQDGKLSLDDDVHKYIQELPDFGARITIRHLIYHTSGLRDQWALLGLAGWRYSLDLITDDDVMDLMSRQKDLNFKPGEKHVYCNTGYTLLAQIVKRVSGQSFREFTTSRIFEPLGMKSTHFRDDHAEIVKHIAYGYEEGKGRNAYRLNVTNFDTVGATSLLTTVEDLAHWDENFYHPRVGGPELVAQQLQRGKLNSGKELDYAFGLQGRRHLSGGAVKRTPAAPRGSFRQDGFRSRRTPVAIRGPVLENGRRARHTYPAQRWKGILTGVRRGELGIGAACRQSFYVGRLPRGVHLRASGGWRVLAPEHSGAGSRKA